jgi:hypothetical protein
VVNEKYLPYTFMLPFRYPTTSKRSTEADPMARPSLEFGPATISARLPTALPPPFAQVAHQSCTAPLACVVTTCPAAACAAIPTHTPRSRCGATTTQVPLSTSQASNTMSSMEAHTRGPKRMSSEAQASFFREPGAPFQPTAPVETFATVNVKSVKPPRSASFCVPVGRCDESHTTLRTVVSSSNRFGLETSTSRPSENAHHATPLATGAMAVTATVLFLPHTRATPPHWHATSVSHAATSPVAVPVQSSALASSAAIAVTSPKHPPMQRTDPGPFPLSPLVGASTALRLCRKRSNALNLFVLLLLHQSSAPSTPAAHITLTLPPMTQCDAPPRSNRRDLSGPALSFLMLVVPFLPPVRFVFLRRPVKLFPLLPSCLWSFPPPAIVPPAPKPPTAPVKFHSCPSSASKSSRSSSNLLAVAA